MADARRRHARDVLGLRRALSDRLLPALAAAMVFLAALALAGATGAAQLAGHWQSGAARLLLVQVPRPQAVEAGGIARAEAVGLALGSAPGIASAHQLSGDEMAAVLRPWLGADPAALHLPLPAMFAVTLSPGEAAPGLEAVLQRAAPGTLVERGDSWLARLGSLVRSLQACAAAAVGVVAFVAVAVVATATHAGLATRRSAIEIVHGLGAADRLIAGRFAGRVTALVFSGALGGLAVAVPVVLSLAQLAAPFQAASARPDPAGLLKILPPALWGALLALPFGAAAIGWITAQFAVRRWLARLR